eukprot:TRINITY_DN7825_c0_g1_i1.p1 TRINITY_DN7825_c0_g1~~TRINITY_DN7825_c0_g1_i1.p1  ORF type:complete len:249 (-),score=47.44 TRINITY_DN7825_c0_g1_i1:142-861(-)
MYNTYEEDDDPTLEDSHKKKYVVDGENHFLDILDIAGNDSYSHLYQKWFGWADAFVYVYSVTSTYSFDMLPHYRDEIAKIKGTKEFPAVLVATQIDDEDNTQITSKEGRSIAYTYRCPFIEVSSKTGQNIESIFQEIVREMIQWRESRALAELETPPAKRKKSKDPTTIAITAKANITGEITLKGPFKPFKGKKCGAAVQDGVLYFFKSEKDIPLGTAIYAINLLTCNVKMAMGPASKK